MVMVTGSLVIDCDCDYEIVLIAGDFLCFELKIAERNNELVIAVVCNG